MAKQVGYLGFLKRNTTGSTYATVGQIMSLSEVGFEKPLIDVSAHGDTVADFLPGRAEGTEVELNIALDPADAQHVAIKADFDNTNQTARNYQLQHPNYSTRCLQFPVLVTKYAEEATDDGAYEMHVTFKVTGAMTTPTPS